VLLSRDPLPPFVAMLPGSRIVVGGSSTGIAIAVQGPAQALAVITSFMQEPKLRVSSAAPRCRGLR
jgi:hypothetical protein